MSKQTKKVRIVKTHEERKQEILNVSLDLFKALGYANTTVEAIIKEIGIAKGTFYHYFKSKDEVLSEIAQRTVESVANMAQQVANDPTLNALEKFQKIIRGGSPQTTEAHEVADILHAPENRELDEAINKQTILQIGPILADIIEQGNKEGLANVDRPLETIQFLLAGETFITNKSLFDWSPEQQLNIAIAMQTVIERSLGVAPGSFNFLGD